MEYPEIFNDCIEIILKNEGGYVEHPLDPGGATNMGITHRNYPNEDIKNLTKEKAIHLYYRDYWTPMGLEQLLNRDLVLAVFDMGVNSGIRNAIKILQRLVGVTDDGFIGTKTLMAIDTYKGDIVSEYNERRKLFYTNLAKRRPELGVFLTGWLNRVKHTKF
jgi:lysozyme family protein